MSYTQEQSSQEKISANELETAEKVGVIVANYLISAEKEAVESRGHRSFSNQYIVPKLGSLTEDDRRTAVTRMDVFVRELQDVLTDEQTQKLSDNIDTMSMALEAKSIVCALLQNTGEKADSLKHRSTSNLDLAKDFVGTYLPEFYAEGLHGYFEDELGIVLLYEQQTISSFNENGKVGGGFKGVSVVYDAEATYLPLILIAGADTYTFQPYEGATFFTANTYFHERFHALNWMLFKDVFGRWSEKDFSLQDEFLAQYLSDYRAQGKVVFESSYLQGLISSPLYAHLRDGIDDFEHVVRDARTALLDLTTFYDLELNDMRHATYLAIAVASHFPIQQWGALAKVKYDVILSE